MEAAAQDPALNAIIGGIVVIVFGALGYGIYASFGPGKKELRDTIDEHARMHELGIAHGHSPKDKHNPARSLF